MHSALPDRDPAAQASRLREVGGHYRPEIDELRAIAILCVLIFHAFPALLPGGFIGVDIFFVISGYLISTIIFTKLDAGGFSLRDFFARRVRRIFPALLFVMLLTLCAGWFLYLPDEWKRLGKHGYNGLLFILNINFMQENGYFEPAAEMKPFLHLWSLCIEEQFYLFWPLLLLWCGKTPRARSFLIGGIGGASLLASVILSPLYPSFAFYLPITRFWELLAGAGLAHLTLQRRVAAYGNAMALFGLALLLGAALFLRGDAVSWPGVGALLPVTGAALIIGAGQGAWLNRHLLSSRVMIAIGLISYPLYLWHWPLLAFAKTLLGPHLSIALTLGLVTLSFAGATLTYFFVEKPLRFSPRLPHKTVLLLGLWLTVFLLALAVYARLVPARLDFSVQA